MKKLRFEDLPEVNSERWLSMDDFDGEEWRDVVGYEGIYLVSNYGRIKSLPRCRPTDKRETHNNIRRLMMKERGYYMVSLSKENKVKWISVHRLVAMAFISNDDNLPQVNHRDENKTNNCVSNLEWCTSRYNCLYGTGRLRQKESRRLSDMTNNSRKVVGDKNSKKVFQKDINGIVIATYNSICEAARKTGGHVSDISRCCHGLAKQSKGYKWSFA